MRPDEGERPALRRYLHREVRAADGELLGHVSDVLADPGSGIIAWLVLRVRGRMRRHRAVPVNLSIEVADRLVVPTSRTDLLASPPIRPNAPLRAEQERTLRARWFTG